MTTNNTQPSRMTVALTLLVLLAGVLILKGWPVPSGTEIVYHLTAYKQFHPDFLLNDWTFSIPQPEHRVFELIGGMLLLIVSPEVFGWTGRLVCWILILLALYRIGRRYEIPSWMIATGILVWLAYDQALVGHEYMIGSFESKSVAYVFLLFAINGFLDGRHIIPGLFLGLAFTFHSAVGLWGCLAVGCTLLAIRFPVKNVLATVACAALGALPGLVFLLPAVMGSAQSTVDDWKFAALVRFPYHLDPLSWPKRDILSVYMLFLFSWVHSRQARENNAIQFLAWFQGFLCTFFTVGILLRIGEQYQWLKFMPMRLFPEFSLLLFFFHLMHAYRHSSSFRLGSGTVILAFFSLLGLRNPFGEFVDQARFTYINWSEKATDLQRTYQWFPAHTAKGSIIIGPPWNDDSVYMSQRAQVAYWGYAPPGQLSEWRTRFRALVSDEWQQMPGETYVEQMEPLYSKLTEEDIAAVVKKYGGDYLVSKGRYSYPILYDSGTYKVYSLNRQEHSINSAVRADQGMVSYHQPTPDRSAQDGMKTESH